MHLSVGDRIINDHRNAILTDEADIDRGIYRKDTAIELYKESHRSTHIIFTCPVTNRVTNQG